MLTLNRFSSFFFLKCCLSVGEREREREREREGAYLVQFPLPFALFVPLKPTIVFLMIQLQVKASNFFSIDSENSQFVKMKTPPQTRKARFA
jgi:hypothetical protein